MFGQTSPSIGMPNAPLADPNELLRRIDQQTLQTYHWVRAGTVAVIVLLILIAIGF